VSLDLLVHEVRPPRGEAAGALVLFHGRGASEHDLFPLLDLLDPERRLLGVTPRGPLSLPPGGAHWYVVRRVGYPDPGTFSPTFETVGSWLDALERETGIPPDRTFLGGFSQGAVMGYALTLAHDRPRYAGLLAFSGFVPTVSGLELDPTKGAGLPIAIGHGIYDPVISVEFSRAARSMLEDAGADVAYREYPLPHMIDPDYLTELAEWLGQRVAASSDSSSS
jgi:phospholipase/carboxylesterase